METSAHAKEGLGQGHGPRVVVHADRQCQLPGQRIPNWHITPAQVGGHDVDPGVRIHQPGSAHTDSNYVMPGHTALDDGLIDQGGHVAQDLRPGSVQGMVQR